MDMFKKCIRLVKLGFQLLITGIRIEILTSKIGKLYKRNSSLASPKIGRLARKLLSVRESFYADEAIFKRMRIWLMKCNR